MDRKKYRGKVNVQKETMVRQVSTKGNTGEFVYLAPGNIQSLRLGQS